MSSGMTLKEALQSKFGGKFNCFSGKPVGQKKLHLEELVQQTLKFDVALPGELPGATAEDEAMGTNGLGLTRAILEVLIDGLTLTLTLTLTLILILILILTQTLTLTLTLTSAQSAPRHISRPPSTASLRMLAQ